MRMVKTAMAATVLLGLVGAAHGQTISIGFASEPGRTLAISGASLPERNGYVMTVSHPLGVDWLEATSELSRTEAEGSAVPRVLAGVRVSPVDVRGIRPFGRVQYGREDLIDLLHGSDNGWRASFQVDVGCDVAMTEKTGLQVYAGYGGEVERPVGPEHTRRAWRTGFGFTFTR